MPDEQNYNVIKQNDSTMRKSKQAVESQKALEKAKYEFAKSHNNYVLPESFPLRSHVLWETHFIFQNFLNINESRTTFESEVERLGLNESYEMFQKKFGLNGFEYKTFRELEVEYHQTAQFKVNRVKTLLESFIKRTQQTQESPAEQ